MSCLIQPSAQGSPQQAGVPVLAALPQKKRKHVPDPPADGPLVPLKMAARSGGNLPGSNHDLALAAVLPDFPSDLKQGPPPLPASVSPPVLRRGGRGTYWGQPVVKASVTLAFGPRPTAAQLPGRSHCPGSCPLHTCTGGGRGTASVEGAESMPECPRLELKRAFHSPERRSTLATVTQAAGKGPAWPGFAS